MKIKIMLAILAYTLVSSASNISVTFSPPVFKTSLGTNIVLGNIKLTTEDTSFNHGNFVWTLDYIPHTRFITDINTNGEGSPGYCYCGRIQDFDLFTDWKIHDGQSNIIGTGYVILPSYPTNALARVVLTNIPLVWNTNYAAEISITTTLIPQLSSDISRGFISGDEVGVFLSKQNLQISSSNDTATISFSNAQPISRAVIDRPSYSIISSIREVGNDLIITAHVDPNKSFVLQTCDNLMDQGPYHWYYGAGESILSSKYGEIFFSVPKSSANQRYFRIVSLDNPDESWFVQLEIITPENSVGPIIPSAGIVQIGSSVKALPILQVDEYHWLTDMGETGSATNFAPTFTAGVHWVKLLVRGAATDATAFKWVIVYP